MDPSTSSQHGSSSSSANINISRVASPEALSPTEQDPDLDALIDSTLASKRVSHLTSHRQHATAREDSKVGGSRRRRISDVFRRNRKRSTTSSSPERHEGNPESPVEERNTGGLAAATDRSENAPAFSDDAFAPTVVATGAPINLVVRKRSDLTDAEREPESGQASGSGMRQPSSSAGTQASGRRRATSSSIQGVVRTASPIEGTSSDADEDLLDVYAESSRQAALEQVSKLRLEVDRKYVWDVLFENQRGILFFGYPKFSAGLLMPTIDPPGWTIPAHQPHAVSAHPTTATAAAEHTPPDRHTALKQGGHQRLSDDSEDASSGKGRDGTTSTRWNQDRAVRLRRHRQSMATPYDLHTYQLPSGAWKWITPWLINMRQDGFTDERGWEYNYFFRRRGWGSKVGRLGWGGWVRRRMWIRLRMLDEEDVDKEKSFSMSIGDPPQERKLDRDILRVGKEDEDD